MKKEIVVISIGGSLIVPGEIDASFLSGLKKVLLKHIKKGKRFILIAGGGRTARRYQAAASEVGRLTLDDLDWLGIHATRLNAHLLRTVLKDISEPKVVFNPTKKISFSKQVLVAAGWKPGFSTDYDAVLLAKQFGVKKIINLSNIDYVYDKDPRKYNGAKKIEVISWRDFRKIVGSKWDPGLNAPFDPIASKECERLKMVVFIANGKNLDNLDSVLSEDDFIGTMIG